LVGVVGPERIVFSLDLNAGQPLTNVTAWRAMAPLAIAEAAIAAGVRRLIVLDLANVGVDGGVGTLALCHELRTRQPHIEIIAGGGVRGPDDLAHMASAGCNAALVASALHDGRIDFASISNSASE
jgi:phosphoribosylformimino-5-aminoimidazole carboxamide ribotide isomerase